MWKIAKRFKVRFGSFVFENVPQILVYENTPIITLVRDDNTGYLGIDGEVRDPFGERIAVVKHNQVYPVRGHEKDYTETRTADHFTVLPNNFNAPVLDIRIRQAAKPLELDVSAYVFLPNGFWMNASPDQIMTSSKFIFSSGFTVKDADRGIVILENRTLRLPNLHT
jgi:hypothetical protein